MPPSGHSPKVTVTLYRMCHDPAAHACLCTFTSTYHTTTFAPYAPSSILHVHAPFSSHPPHPPTQTCTCTYITCRARPQRRRPRNIFHILFCPPHRRPPHSRRPTVPVHYTPPRALFLPPAGHFLMAAPPSLAPAARPRPRHSGSCLERLVRCFGLWSPPTLLAFLLRHSSILV